MDAKEYKGKVFHVISNTHWDREWRFCFQENRQMLVQMIDQVLDILESDKTYRAFHLDSQSIVLDDYLEIRPHKQETIQKLVKAKRLLVGPWYILPDEFLVGGENLIRNLLLGHRVSSRAGRTSKIGYSPFSWGQISQLPQIYRQFGIELIMFYRGVNSLDSHNAEFIWEGADGTRSLSSRFSTMPRYNFYFYIYRPVFHNEDMSELEFKWQRGGVPFHFSTSPLSDDDYFTADTPNDYFEEQIVPAVTAIIQKQAQDFTTPHIIWMEGHDSSGPNKLTPRLIRDIKKKFPGIDVRHSTLEEYAELVKNSVNLKKLPIVKGERRSAQYDRRSGNLFGYVTSARMYLKQKNFEAEKWLQYYSEPLYNFMGLNGMDTQDRYLRTAWNFLIQNSAHDSIGGCSLDAVHDDMMSRYKQVIEIAQGCYRRASMYLSKSISTSSFSAGTDDIFLTIYNPLQFERCAIVTANLDVPAESGNKAVSLQDSVGNVIEAEVLHSEYVEPVMEQLINRPLYLKMNRLKVSFEAKSIPGLGYKTYKVLLSNAHDRNSRKKSYSENSIQNEFIKVTLQENGTFSLYDKKNRKTYRKLGLLYDEGEAGHAWVHTPIPPEVTSENLSVKNVRVVKNHHTETISFNYQLRVPHNRKSSSKRAVYIPVEIQVEIQTGCPALFLRIRLTNTAKNHRLRMLFPTGIKQAYHFAEGQFDVVKRSNRRPDTRGWVEQPMYDYPAHHFIAQCDKNFGFAVFNNGIKEYEVLEDQSTIAVTLLRGFTHVIQPSSLEDYSDQPGSQCFGISEYSFGIRLFRGESNLPDVLPGALAFSYPMTAMQHGTSAGELPPTCSFLSIDNDNLVVSSIKEAEDGQGIIVRIHNPTSFLQKGKISFYNPLKYAETVTLEEKKVQSLSVIKKYTSIRLKPKQIFTLRAVF